jgi:hypothetical protein
MGDMNAATDSKELLEFASSLGLTAPTEGLASYPSWQPQRAIDHIFISERIIASKAAVLDVPHSDHCPVELVLKLPPDIILDYATRPVIDNTGGIAVDESRTPGTKHVRSAPVSRSRKIRTGVAGGSYR